MVEDVDALWHRIRALGISPTHAIGSRFYGLRDFTLADPSGFEIRFSQALVLTRRMARTAVPDSASTRRSGSRRALDATMGVLRLPEPRMTLPRTTPPVEVYDLARRSLRLPAPHFMRPYW